MVTPKYIISKGGVLIPQTGPGHGGGAHLVAGSNFPSPGCRIADGFFFDFFRFGHFRSREGSGWTGFVKLVTNHCLTACGDHSRSVSCNICPFLVVRGSTAHPPGRQVRVLNHWAAARRSRPLSSRPPLDLLSTSPRPPLDLPSTSPRHPPRSLACPWGGCGVPRGTCFSIPRVDPCGQRVPKGGVPSKGGVLIL